MAESAIAADTRAGRTDGGAAVSLGRRLSGPATSVLLPGAVFLVLVALLEIAKRANLLPVTIPAPSAIAVALTQSYGDLLYHMEPTVLASLAGYALAVALALILSALAISWPKLERPVLDFGIIVDSVPLVALTPILMVWLGTGMLSRIILAAIAAFFPLVVGAIQGFKAVDRNASELFHVLSASRRHRLFKLSLPTALPYLFAALKISAPLAILGALIAEWINADRGLGIMMVYALFSFNVPLVWLTIITVCALAMTAYGAIALAERLVVRWDAGGMGERG